MARIDVNFNESSDETAVTNQGQTQQGTTAQSNTAKYVVGQAVVQLGRRALQYGASQVGNITGNYLMQNQINAAIQAIGWASSIGVGFATGGVIGGVASALAVAGEIGINAVNYNIELTKRNRNAEYLASVRGGILNANSR